MSDNTGHDFQKDWKLSWLYCKFSRPNKLQGLLCFFKVKRVFFSDKMKIPLNLLAIQHDLCAMEGFWTRETVTTFNLFYFNI